jgi:hypothetical protein
MLGPFEGAALLALPKSIFLPSPEDGNRSNFQNVTLSRLICNTRRCALVINSYIVNAFYLHYCFSPFFNTYECTMCWLVCILHLMIVCGRNL